MNLTNLLLANIIDWEIVGTSTLETLGMVIISAVIAYAIGLPLGVILSITSKNGICKCRPVNLILGFIVNVMRSIPCLLLIVITIPLSNIIIGKGNWSGYWYSMIIPLVFSSFAYIARVVEQSLTDVPAGEVEAITTLGASKWQIITKVLIPEAKVSLLIGVLVTIVNIIGYTSFAGYIGAGGLIAYAFTLGYYGSNTWGMWFTVLVVVIIVQVIQEVGLILVKKTDKRRKIS